MYCIITNNNGYSKVEAVSYWVKDSYKMRSIDSHLKRLGKTLSVEYVNHGGGVIDTIILGK